MITFKLYENIQNIVVCNNWRRGGELHARIRKPFSHRNFQTASLLTYSRNETCRPLRIHWTFLAFAILQQHVPNLLQSVQARGTNEAIVGTLKLRYRDHQLPADYWSPQSQDHPESRIVIGIRSGRRAVGQVLAGIAEAEIQPKRSPMEWNTGKQNTSPTHGGGLSPQCSP
jgi:hypothetical protein